MNSKIAVAVGLAAVLAAVLVPISTPAYAAEIAAEIKTGSSSLTTDAFAPNPLEINVGDTVTWTNRDSTPHTVTSGSNAQADGIFDSSPDLNPLLAPQQTFSHTFEEAGEFPYFCVLHPNMVGTVMVASGSDPGPAPTPDPEPTEEEFSVTATFDGNEYVVTGTGNASATEATINPGQSVVIEFSGGGEVELTLPKAMIDEISAVQVGTETIQHEVLSNDTEIAGVENATTTISFEIPEGETTVTIQAATVVPEFPVIAAILAVTIAGIIGYTRFARNGTGFFGRA